MTTRASTRLFSLWESFWFRESPGEIFALLRLAFGALGLMTILSLVPVEAFWTPGGLMPLPGGGLGVRAALIDAGVAYAAGWLLFLALVVTFVCVTLGYRSATVVPVSVGLTIAHHYWNSLPLSGGHDVLLVVLFYLAWADCGGRPSVDAWLAARRGTPMGEGEPRQSVWPLKLICFHITLIYFTSGLWKLSSPAWRDGSALHYVLNLNSYARFPNLLSPEFEWLATVGTYATLFWELTFPFLLLHRWTRVLALLAGVAMHAAMWATIELGLFSAMMLASYLAFLNPHDVSRVASSIERRLNRLWPFERSQAGRDTLPA